MGTPQSVAVDALIQRVFALTLQRDRANANADPPITHLPELAQACYFEWPSSCKISITHLA